jgi:hypothetical protein
MAKKDSKGNWLDSKGNPVSEEYIPLLDRKRDSMVEKVFKKVKKLENDILSTKLEVIKEVDSYLAERAKAGKVKEAWKGNICLETFDGSKKINRSMDDLISFNEQLQMVKTVIDEWISDRLTGIDDSLAKVIRQAFSVDKRKRINTSSIMKLLQLDIKDSKWQKAMNLLKDSIVVTSTRMYLTFSEKIQNGSGESWRSLCLDFASANNE